MKSTKELFGVAKAISMISQIGITMIVCIFVGVWGGNWLDEHLGTHGICLIVCILVSIAAGFVNVYKLLMKGNKKQDE